MTTLLLVDDNTELIDIHSSYLREHGYAVETASEGSQALEILQSSPIDLLITDIIMPGKEGFETIMAVRELYPDMPIIAISGGGRLEAKDYLGMAQGLGAMSSLPKPFSASALHLEVQKLLKS